MPWPTPQDYNEAIQNPATCFADEGLRRGEVESNALGLPRSITGAFASVYRVTENNKSWAVRCFLKFRPDQQERYEKVSQYVMFDELEYTVHFEYLSKGIRVRGEWFPLLKMEWVEGQTLDQYLEAHVKSRSQVKSLLVKFDTMMAEMKAAGIAHGDLQHGNIMVVNGDLRLVDYDGMYVPKLAGWPSLELGHSNYQHPLRSETDFDPALDNFSAHVIRTSLLTLIEDQSLWNDSHVGDECLLFKKRDFVQPENSELFAHLLAHKSKEVQAAAASLAYLCKCLPSHVPYLGATQDEILSIPIYVPSENDVDSVTADREIYQKNRYFEGDSGADGTRQRAERAKTDRFKSGVISSVGTKLRGAADKAWDYVVPKLSPRFAAERAIADGDKELEETDYSKAIANYTRALQIVENTKGTVIDGALQTYILAKIATACLLDHRPALVTHHLKEALKNYCDPESPYCDKALAHVALTCFEKGMIKEARSVMWNNFRDKNKLLSLPGLLKGSHYENRESVAQLLALLSEVHGDLVDDYPLALACCEMALAHYERSDLYEGSTAKYEAIAKLRMRKIHCHLSIDQIGSADQQCAKLWQHKQHLNSDIRARLVFLQSFFESLSGDFDKAFKTLTENTTQLTVLERSLKEEMRSALKTYFSGAEFLREMGIRYAARNLHEESKLCYGSAAWMYRDFRKTAPREHAVPEGRNTRAAKKSHKSSFGDTYQLKYVECLIGQYELAEAAKLLKRITATEQKEAVKKLEAQLALAFEAAGDFGSALALLETQQGSNGNDVKRIKASAHDAQLKKAQQLETSGKYKDAKRLFESLDGDHKADIDRLKGLIRQNDLNTAERLVTAGAFEDALNMYLRLEPVTSENVISTRCKLINELLELGKGHGDIIADYGKLRHALDHIEELANNNTLTTEKMSDLTALVCGWGMVRGRSFRRWIESLSDCISMVEGASGDCVRKLQNYEKTLAEKRVIAEPQKQSKNPFAAAAVLLSDSGASSESYSNSQESSQEDSENSEDVVDPVDRPKPSKSSALAESLMGQGLFQIHNRRIAAAQDSFTKAIKQCTPSSHANVKAVLGLSLSLFLTEDNNGATEQIESLSNSLDQVVVAMQEITQGFTVKIENAAEFAYLAATTLEESASSSDNQIAKLYRQAYDLFKRANKSKPVQQLDCFAGFARVEEIEKELEKYRTSQTIAEKPFKIAQSKIAKRWVRQGKFNAAKELFELLDGPKSEDLKWCLEEQTMFQIAKACTSERKGDGPLREAFHVLTELNQRKLLTSEFCLSVATYLRENLPHASVLSGMGKELRRLSDLFVSVEGKDGPAAGMLLSRIKGTGY